MKKRFSKMFAVMLAIALVLNGHIGEVKAAYVVVQTKDGITWEFDASTGVMRITGEGVLEQMDDWVSYKSLVKELIIEKGITEIRSDLFAALDAGCFDGCENMVKITLPEGLKSIGEIAFRDCGELQEIKIPSTVTEIGENAFSGCSQTTKISLPEGLTTISAGAFSGCEKLQEIEIPSTVTQIGARAFQNCKKVTKISLPEGLKIIGGSAFSNCEKLEKMKIPSTVTQIGGYAFMCCEELQEIEIPSNITEIGMYTFQYCKKATKISLPEGLKTISVGAFSGCHALTEIEIPSTVTEIGDSAFSSCYKVTKISLPEGLKTIGKSAFYFCRELQEIKIPSTVTEIGEAAFGDCYKATKISLPERLTIIDERTFSNCEKLQEIKIPSTVTKIGNSAFYGCNNITKLVLPEGLERIGEGAFYTYINDTAFNKVILPSTLTQIDSDSFNKSVLLLCNNDYQVQYSQENGYAYGDISNGLDLSKAHMSIPEFAYVYTGKEIKPELQVTYDFNGGRTEVLQENEDYSLTYSNNINCGMAEITITGLGIYKGEQSLEYEIYKKIEDCNISLEYDSILYSGEKMIPAVTVREGEVTLKENEDYELKYENNIEEGTATVTITGKGSYKGSVVKEFAIYKISMKDCDISLEYDSILYSGKKMLPAVTVRDGNTVLKENEDYELKYENNVEEGTATVTVTGKGIYKDSVPKTFQIYKLDITSYAFIQEYTEVIYDGTEKRPAITVKDLDGNILKEGEDYRVSYENYTNPGEATVTIRGIGIYKGEKVLRYTIQKISIDPADVTLDETIFSYDGSPKKPQVIVTLQGKTLTKDVDYSVDYENNIVAGTAYVVIQGMGVYQGEIRMTFTILPYGSGSDSVYDKDHTLLSKNLIYSITDDEELEVEVVGVSKKNIRKMVIPATVVSEGKTYTVTSIGHKAFYKNTKITSIVIGNNVTSIEDYAFYGCKNVKSINMGKSVEIIGASSFRKCTKLTKITLPKSVDELGKNAFYGCKKLKTIIINANSVVDISANAIKGISKRAVIKVPKKLVKGYKKEFKKKTGFRKTMRIKKK